MELGMNEDLVEDLKGALDRTYRLAVGLEMVGKSVNPYHETGGAGRRRLNSIKHELKAFTDHIGIETPRKVTSASVPRRNSHVVHDSPTIRAKRLLFNSVKNENMRVTQSRLGKRSLGNIINPQAMNPPMLKTTENFQEFFQEFKKTHRSKITEDKHETKPMPYVCLIDGSLDDPINLPTFEEFFDSKGGQAFKDDIFMRIEKLISSLGELRTNINREIARGNYSPIRRRIQRRNAMKTNLKNERIVMSIEAAAKLFCPIEKKRLNIIQKTNEFKAEIKTYYSVDGKYKRINQNKCQATDDYHSIEESLRNLYQSKASENEKIGDILERMEMDKPFNVKLKLDLIKKDKEKFKNQGHSIRKFNKYKTYVENFKRKRQNKVYEQGVAYITWLRDFSKLKHEPSEAEMLFLELWRQLLQGGWPIREEDLEVILKGFTPQEINDEYFQALLEHLKSSID